MGGFVGCIAGCIAQYKFGSSLIDQVTTPSNSTIEDACNITLLPAADPPRRISPADEYFHNHVVSISEGLHESGIINWRLVVALFVAWFITCLVLIRGPKSSGKVFCFYVAAAC